MIPKGREEKKRGEQPPSKNTLRQSSVFLMEEEDLNYRVPEVGVEFVVLLLRQVGARQTGETGERETSRRCKKDWQLAGGK